MDGSNELHELQKRIIHALKQAESCVLRHHKSDPVNASLGGWLRNFNIDNDTFSLIGTACAIIALLKCGYNRNDDCIYRSVAYIEYKASNEKWWTDYHSSSTLDGLTRSTSLALDALVAATAPNVSSVVVDGLNWLIQTQHSDGYWGHKKDSDDDNDLISTCYALKTLAHVRALISGTIDLQKKLTESINKGCNWLNKKKECGHWTSNSSTGKDAKTSLAYTSHVVETLLDCEVQILDSEIYEWLYSNLPESDIMSDPINNQYSWNHLLQERALIGLLRLGTRVSDRKVMKISQDILKRQQNGYWTISNQQSIAPSWAIFEAVVSLKLYLDHIERYWHIELIHKLENQVSNLENQVSDIENKDKSQQKIINDLISETNELEHRVTDLESQFVLKHLLRVKIWLKNAFRQHRRLALMFTWGLVLIILFATTFMLINNQHPLEKSIVPLLLSLASIVGAIFATIASKQSQIMDESTIQKQKTSNENIVRQLKSSDSE